MVLSEYLIHYNRHRPHQSRQQRPPDIETQPTRDAPGPLDLRRIHRKCVVKGMISEYHHAAQPQAGSRSRVFERDTR